MLLVHAEALLDSLLLRKEGKLRSFVCIPINVKARLEGGGVGLGKNAVS